MPETMVSKLFKPLKLRSILFIILVFSAVFYTYRFGIYDLPRMDHLFFLKEQDFAKSDWQYFWRMISYNRSAYIANGDYFLYRPGFFGYLALVVIFFRENLLFSGILSLVLHAICTLISFNLLKRVMSSFWAGLLAMSFCIQYSGMEMLIWRHISPYMIGIILFFSGALIITKRDDLVSQKNANAAGTLFFFSTLFHESFPFTLCALGLISIFHKNYKQSRLFLIPALLWLLLNIADYCYYHPQNILGTDQSSPFLTFQNSAFNIIFLAGLFLGVFLFPYLIHIEYENFFTERGSWDPTSWPTALVFCLGIIFLICISLWLIFKMRDSQKRSDQSPDLSLMIGVYLIVLILGFGVGRLTVRTTEYLRIATYYYYIANFSLVYLMALALQQMKCKFNSGRKSSVLLIVLVVVYMAMNYRCIQKVLSERFAPDFRVAKTVAAIDNSLSKSDEYCFGGSVGDTFAAVFSREIVLRQSCLRKKGKPLYLVPPENDERLVLAELIRPSAKPVPIPLGQPAMIPNSHLVSAIDSDYQYNGSETGLLSVDSYQPSEIQVDLMRLSEAGMVFAFQNERNLVALNGYQGQLLIFMNRWGITWSHWYRNALIGNDEFIRLAVRKIGGGYIAFFCNEKLIQVFAQGDQLSGRIGLYSIEKRSVQTLFRNLTYIPEPTDPQDQFKFWPAFEITLSKLYKTTQKTV